MKKYLYTILAAALIQMPFQAAAKSVEKDNAKGEYFFAHHGYNKALAFYTDLLDKSPRQKNPLLCARIADCYRLTGQPDQAAAFYSRALNDAKPATGKHPAKAGINKNTANAQLPNDVTLHYGEVLMTLQCYEDAAMWLREYLATTPNDRRAANLVKGCEHAAALRSGMPEGVETFLSLNTDLSEYGPVINNQCLVYTSDTTPVTYKKKDKFTGEYFFKLYQVTATEEGHCSNDFQSVETKGLGKFHDANCAFTKDGQTMYFTRNNVENDIFGQSSVPDDRNKVHLQIMIASDYNKAANKFETVTPFPYNNKDYSTAHPAINPNGDMLIFTSDMPGGEGGTDLYMCRKDNDGKWAAPQNIGKTINTEGAELLPVFLDNNTITFTSNGHPGLGGEDVYYATWNNATQSWGNVVNAGVPVNSSYDDMSLTMYNDGQNGYFASNRPAEKGSENIFHYYRQKLVLKLNLVNSSVGNAIDGATVTLQGAKDIHSLITDAQGSATTPLYPLTSYKVTINKKGYKELKTVFSTSNIKRLHDVDTFYKTIQLEPEQDITFTAKILDEETRKPIDNPLMVISKEGSNHTDTINMATGTPFNHMLEPNAIYHINAVKDSYYSDEKVVSTMGLTGTIKLSDTMLMCRLGVGVICQIESIYYDFNKATIRTDALPSLDKLLKFMHFFPHMRIQLNSHTDCRGSDAYNMRLSNARAQAVVKYLISKGIKANRLQGKGFGESKPIYKCDNCETCDESYRQQNRRTEFQVLSM